jgi:hypothetical protein
MRQCTLLVVLVTPEKMHYMDHAVVENEKRPTESKQFVSDASNMAAAGSAHQPTDATTMEGAIANEANPNIHPR